MITLILSDLHLGARNCQAAFIRDALEMPFDRLILNGDTVNNLNFKKFKPKHWRLLSRLKEIAQKRELILIRGNHDGAPIEGLTFGPLQVLATLLGVPLHEEYRLSTPGGDYLVLHGDRFDPTLNWPILTDTADWCYGAVQKINKKAAKWLKRRVKRMGGVVEFVKRRSVKYAKNQGYQGIITGHTHFCDDEWIDSIHYLNSGCWVDPACTYVSAADADVKLCHWVDAGAISLNDAERGPETTSSNGHLRLPPVTWKVPRHNGIIPHDAAAATPR
jgi:UDP-2,3-diacylglucosamine pyrophosphatase LpxH